MMLADAGFAVCAAIRVPFRKRLFNIGVVHYI
jgi:hypothetical protein